MIGIYKITSPSNKVYIGQSIDIEKRFKGYYKLHCKDQYKLYNSLNKYGSENHIFEIIEECEISELNSRERYWQDFYDVLGKNGLNLQLVNTNFLNGVRSEEIKNKISNSLRKSKRIYKPISESIKKKMKESRKKNPRFYKEFIEKEFVELFVGIKDKSNIYTSKKVINIESEQIYNSAKEVSEKYGIKYGYLMQQLNGSVKNNTKFKYYNKMKTEFKKGDRVKVVNSSILEGNENGPKLTLNDVMEVKGFVLDSKGNQHLDVGLISNLNYITSWDVKGEELPDGNKIHWCHPSRFEVISS